MTSYKLIFRLFVICLLISNAGYAQKTDREKMNLKGKVKSMVQIEYKIDDDSEDEARLKYTFNAKGNKVSEESVDRQGNLAFRITYQYDKAGRLASETEINDLLGSNISKTYKYNAAGKLAQIETAYYGKGRKKDILRKDEYTYDSEGNTNIELLKKEGMTNESFVQKHDADGNLTEEIHTEGNDVVKTVFVYSDRKILTSKEEYNKHGRLRYKTVYEYDKFDNVVTETLGYEGGTTTTFNYIYDYDAKGNWKTMREQTEDKTFNVVMRNFEFY